MKKILFISAAVFSALLICPYAFAQMGGGYGMGPGMGGGYGMGPGMGGGFGMGPGMMGYNFQNPECQKFLDDTFKLRKELHDKRFDYFETIRNPKTTGETASKLMSEMRELQENIFAKAPMSCMW